MSRLTISTASGRLLLGNAATLDVVPSSNPNAFTGYETEIELGSAPFVLRNTGLTLLSVTVTRSQTWVNIEGGSSYSTSVGPGESESIAVTLNSGVNSLPVGTHTATITFTSGNGQGTTTRTITVEVLADPSFATLVPGSGWTGATAQPSPVGSPGDPGYAARVIARWDVVPYQTFSGELLIGVVAFHMNGVDRVEFSVNNGPWTSVTTPLLNPTTGVVEYTVRLQASDFADGQIEVRAIAYPETAGEPRVLAGVYDVTRAYNGTEWTGEHSLILHANSGGTLVEEVVELAAGDYTWGVAPLFFGTQAHTNRWLTYRPAAGVARADVRITATTALVPAQRNFSKIRLQNVTMYGSNADLSWFNNTNDKMLWLDNVRVEGAGQWVSTSPSASAPHQWWTDCHISDVREGLGKQFVRNCLYERIGEDATREIHTIINTDFKFVDAGATSWHSGVFGNPHKHSNRIFYGVNVTDTGGSVVWPMRNGSDPNWENHNIAIVNCTTYGEPTGVGHCWFWGAETKHLYVLNCVFYGRCEWRQAGVGVLPDWVFSAENVVLENSNWQAYGGSPSYPTPLGLPGVTIRP